MEEKLIGVIIVYKVKLYYKRIESLWCGRIEYGTKRVDRILEIWKGIATRHPDWNLYIMESGNLECLKTIVQMYYILNFVFTGTCN